MTITLRPYQETIISDTREALRRHRRVLIRLMVGGGKTALAADMLGGAARRQKRSFFNVHRQELIDQTAETFDKVGISYGIVASGYPENPFEPIQICSVDTLKNRLHKIQKPDLIIEDEAHHSVSAGRKKILEFYNDVKIVGLTATPERLDGCGLSAVYDYMVEGPEAEWLIENGFLSDYRAFAFQSQDFSSVKSSMGDFDKHEVEIMLNDSVLIGNAIHEYLKIGRDKKAIVFAVSINHSKRICADFIAAGVNAAHLDGETPKAERKRIVAAFKRGEIKVLCNVDLFGEGFNLPDLDIVILMRPTKSLGLYIQQVGRVLRTSPNKEYAYILDHVGNIARHGLPDMKREWSLNSKKRGKKTKTESFPVKTCPECFCSHKPAPSCPECGTIYEVQPRELKHMEGVLTEIDRGAMIRQRKIEQGSAKTYEQLVQLGKEKGYKNPSGWAYHIIRARGGKR